MKIQKWSLCIKYLGIKAGYVINYTLLLNKKDYLDLILSEEESLSPVISLQI